jgi:hypothetical protein
MSDKNKFISPEDIKTLKENIDTLMDEKTRGEISRAIDCRVRDSTSARVLVKEVYDNFNPLLLTLKNILDKMDNSDDDL